MAPRGLCHGCWDEGHAWQRCPHRPKGGIPAFSKRGGCGSNGKAKVADEEEQDDKAEAVVGEAVAAVGEEQPREGWWIDTGASHNFTPYASDFQMRTPPLGRAVYVLSLIDDFTRRVWSFPLPNKESTTVVKVIRQWHKDVELECGRKLKVVRSDRGGEFSGDAVKAWKAEFGIKTQLRVADTPQQNGVVERWHRDDGRGDSHINRVIHSALPASITPMEAWSSQKPHVGMARIWGCMGSVMLHGHEKGGKLDARAVMCVCVGVDMESKGWHMLDPSLMRIHIARDVDFLENQRFDDAEMPSSSLPLAPLSVSVQQMPTPSAAAQWPLGHPEEIRYTGYFLFLLPGQRSVPLSTGAPPSPATTSPPPVTGLQMLGIQSGTGGEEVAGDAGVVEGMLCLAREVEGVALAGVSTGDVNEVLAQRYEMKDLVLRSTKTHSHARCTESTQRTKHINVPWHFVRDAVRQQEVEVHSVRSHLQDADMLTKALPSLQLHENLERIGMRVMAAKAKTSFGGGVVF
ncbi:unnamed protein product [Closterium sp. NIES-64]|nr:unnamed protein product [Closterium sp. NIES-64]